MSGERAWSADAPLTLVVPIHGQLEATRRFLASYERQSEPATLLFVDDRSPDDSVAWLRDHGHIVITPPERLWFNGVVDFALRKCRSEILGILNNDLVLGRDFDRQVVDAFQRSPYDLLVPSTVEDLAAIDLDAPRPFKIKPLRRQQGWCMLFRHEAIAALPPIPVDDLKLWFGDTWIFHHAWARKLRVGRLEHVVVFHERSVTIEAGAEGADRKTRRRAHPQIAADEAMLATKYPWLKRTQPGFYDGLPKPLRRWFVPRR